MLCSLVSEALAFLGEEGPLLLLLIDSIDRSAREVLRVGLNGGVGRLCTGGGGGGGDAKWPVVLMFVALPRSDRTSRRKVSVARRTPPPHQNHSTGVGFLALARSRS